MRPRLLIILSRIALCLSLALIWSSVEAQILRDYSFESALKDLAEGKADLLLLGGISPTVYVGQESFKKHYGIGYYDFGDLPECSDEEMKAYNAVLFSWLYDTYGLEWLNDVRKDAVGLDDWKKDKTSLRGFIDKQDYPRNKIGEISFDRNALIVVDGIVWEIQDDIMERLDPTGVTLDRIMDFNQSISMDDIGSAVLLKKDDLTVFGSPRDVVLIQTKKESEIKTFSLNGKQKIRNRGIELGALLNEAILKGRIQKLWRINSKRITAVSVEGKSISISTK